MSYIVIDTETSSLSDNGRPADDVGQPRLLEFAALFINDRLEIEREYQTYVQPDGTFEIHPKAFEKHGLTLEFVKEHGAPIDLPLAVYSTAIKEGRGVITYNAQFDCKVMRGEMRRAGISDMFYETPNVCTMRGIAGMKLGIKKLNGKGGSPRLLDCSAHFNVSHEGAHGALADARAAHGVLIHMVRLGFEIRPEVHLSKNHEAIEAARIGPR